MLVMLSRIQFAFTVAFHFLFVPFTIGMILLVAIYETIAYRKQDSVYRKMADFWGELFVINFAVGIVTGLTMPVQFGTNWAKYSVFMGDVFGSPLAFEALLAFFLESTFAGIWIFKRHKISERMRLITVWLIMIGTTLSSIWIITANGFMQNPVGYELNSDGTKVLLTDFGAVLGNPYAHYMLAHTLLSAFLLGAFAVIGISAYHLKRRKNIDFFMKSIRVAVIVGIVAAILLPIEGSSYARYLGQQDVQPLKGLILRGALEANHEAPDGVAAPVEVSAEQAEIDARSGASIGAAYSMLESLDRQPPITAIRIMYLLMYTLGVLFIIFLVLMLLQRTMIQYSPGFQTIAMAFMPLPYIAITLGWMVAEIGRQPWLVYNLMTVEQGISDVPVGSVVFSMVLLVVLYTVLFIVDFYLLRKKAIAGPETKEV